MSEQTTIQALKGFIAHLEGFTAQAREVALVQGQKEDALVYLGWTQALKAVSDEIKKLEASDE